MLRPAGPAGPAGSAGPTSAVAALFISFLLSGLAGPSAAGGSPAATQSGPGRTLDAGALFASTFYGGSGGDANNEVPCARDADGNIYVACRTNSADLPVTPGAYDSTLGGTFDVFIAKFDASLSRLLAATYLGGSSPEGGWPGISMVLGPDGGVWVSGITKSADFPVTPGAYDATYGGSGDLFIAKGAPTT